MGRKIITEDKMERQLHTIYDLRDMMKRMNDERMATEVLPQNVEAHMDIVYNPESRKPYGSLDVFRPLDTEGKLPVIIDIHGGGFCQGEKDINENYCRHLALEGFVTVNVCYDLVPEVTVDEQLRECLLAFRWVQNNIAAYGGDTGNVFCTGDSAGGYLCLYATAISKSDFLQKLLDTVDPAIDIRAIGLVCPKVFNLGGFGSDILEKVMYRGEDWDRITNYIGNPQKMYEMGVVPPLWFMTTTLDIVREPCLDFYILLQKLQAEFVFRDLPTREGDEYELRHVFNVTRPHWEQSKKINGDMLAFFRRYLHD